MKFRLLNATSAGYLKYEYYDLFVDFRSVRVLLKQSDLREDTASVVLPDCDFLKGVAVILGVR